MSSLTRTMERNIVRNRVESEIAPKRAKLIKKRKDPTKSLGIDRNVIQFKRDWYKYHYGVKEIVDANGNTKTTVSKRKKVKKSNPHISGKGLISRLKFAKSFREKIAEQSKKDK